MRLLCLDLETQPNIAHVWALFNQNISLNQVQAFGEVICFAAKWVGQPGMIFKSVFHDGKEAMLEHAHRLLSEADAVITWNGKSFDIPHLQREFLEAGMPPPPPTTHIDLMLAVKKQFRFTSNKLQHVSTRLGLSGKVQHEGHTLWVRCMAGDQKAWAAMRRYNKQDVALLEELYEKLQPWVPNHPNVALRHGVAVDIPSCPACGCTELIRRGFSYTAMGQFQRLVCSRCGKWSRDNKRVGAVTVTEVK